MSGREKPPMVMSEDSNFDLRKVTELTLTGVHQYDELNLPVGQRDHKFTELVADALTHHPIIPTGEDGAYVRLYTPEVDGKDAPIALKILRDDNNGYDTARRQLKDIDNEVLQEFIRTGQHLLLLGHHKDAVFSDLSEKEQIFVLLAYEHALHEKLYSPYVMPAVFVSFKAKNDVVDPRSVIKPSSSEHEKVLNEIKEDLRKKGRLSDDGKEIYIKQDETVFAMVQNLETFSKSVFEIPYEDFTEPQLIQLADFADTVERVWKETGYFPDPSMPHPQAGNLKFLGDRLVLVDTNSIRRQGRNHNDYPGFIEKIRYIVEQARKLHP